MFMIIMFSLYPPFNVRASDKPNDGGGSILIKWDKVEDTLLAGYEIFSVGDGG
jgi:hypothetical protein